MRKFARMSSINKNIRIMHVAQAAGGVDRYLHCLVKYLNHNKFENILVCSQDFKSVDYNNIADKFEIVEMQRNIGLHDFQTAYIVRKLIRKYGPDIVYAHSSKAGAIVRIANIGIENVCIYNPHGWPFNMIGSSKKQIVFSFMEKIMAPFADKIICISDAEKNSALNRHICSEEKLHVIYSGIDIQQYERLNHSKKRRSDIGIPEDVLVVGMVGRLVAQKAPDIFIRMAKEIKEQVQDAHFLFIGDGYMRKEIEQYAKTHGFIQSVHITGWVDNPLDYVELIDIAVLLSRWEGFGLVIPEYMLCRKPIVATDVDAIPNLIDDHINGLLVPPENPQAACEAVLGLYKDTHLADRLIEHGLKDVYKKYDARRVATEHEMLFQKLVGSFQGGKP